MIFWNPVTGEIGTDTGRAFALGEDLIDNPATTAFNRWLNIYPDPLECLRNNRRGIVGVRCELAFDKLRDVPRIAVADLPQDGEATACAEARHVARDRENGGMTAPFPITEYRNQQKQQHFGAPHGDWRSVTNEGQPVASLANAVAALRNEPALSGLVAYDAMLSLPMLKRPVPKWQQADNSSDFKRRPVTDTEIDGIQQWLQLAGLARLGRDAVHQAVELCADDCKFHPLHDYLHGLNWDRKARIDK